MGNKKERKTNYRGEIMLVNIMKLSRQELLGLSHSEVGRSTMSESEILRLLSALRVWYNYDYAKGQGDELPPHAVLVNKTHTDTYIMHKALCHNSAIVAVLARQLIKKLTLGKSMMDLSPRDRLSAKPIWVIGPSYGSVFLVSAFARELGAWQGMTEKVEGNDQEWTSLPIPNGVVVQLVDDVVMTAGSALAAKCAVLEPLSAGNQVSIQPEIGVIINMSGVTRVGEFKIVSLLELVPMFWYGEDCQLCQQGSPVVSVERNWPQLAEACWLDPPD